MTERTIAPLKFGDQMIYVEVTDIEQEPESSERGGDSGDYEYTSAEDTLLDAGQWVRNAIGTLAGTVHQALSDAQPAEWTLEINLGFNGKAGIPFLTEGGANGAVKVTAKWTRS
jgi:hypothetical protein